MTYRHDAIQWESRGGLVGQVAVPSISSAVSARKARDENESKLEKMKD